MSTYEDDSAVEEHGRLEAWWLGLRDPERAALLPLEEGDALPPGLAGPALTHALREDDEIPASHLDSQLTGFLTEKRAETGGG